MEENKSKAYYENHLKYVRDYQKANPSKCREKCKRYNDKMKAENPEKYQSVLLKKRMYYLNVRKPKLDALKSNIAEK